MEQKLKEVKHPLKGEWTFFFDGNVTGKKPSSEADWDAAMTVVLSFDTVEDFWSLYNNIKVPSTLTPGSNYRLFRSDIEPKWEDEANSNGGRWIIIVPHSAQRKANLDKYWLNLLLACIGERLDEKNEICGVVLSVRRGQDKIAVWTRSADDAEAQKMIGRRLKKSLELPESLTLGYQSHYTESNKNKFEV